LSSSKSFTIGKEFILPSTLQSRHSMKSHILWLNYVSQFSGIDQSLKHLIEVINDFSKKGVFFKSLQENIDTSSSGGKLTFHLFGSLAEFERDIIRERTKAGLEAARARGRVGGRPKALDDKQIQLARQLMSNPSNSASDVSKTLGISRSTLYRNLKSK